MVRGLTYEIEMCIVCYLYTVESVSLIFYTLELLEFQHILCMIQDIFMTAAVLSRFIIKIRTQVKQALHQD